MIISILNCDINFGIGKKNGLLFSLSLDMKFFRETTKGHVVAMGENTLLSFPGSKPLKNRENIVLSKDPTHNYEDVINVREHTYWDSPMVTPGHTVTPAPNQQSSPMVMGRQRSMVLRRSSDTGN